MTINFDEDDNKGFDEDDDNLYRGFPKPKHPIKITIEFGEWDELEETMDPGETDRRVILGTSYMLVMQDLKQQTTKLAAEYRDKTQADSWGYLVWIQSVISIILTGTELFGVEPISKGIFQVLYKYLESQLDKYFSRSDGGPKRPSSSSMFSDN